MLIGIISDTHDHLSNLQKAFDIFSFKKVKVVYHCGDWVSPFIFNFIFSQIKPKFKIRGVLGNNEGARFTLGAKIQSFGTRFFIKEHFLSDVFDGKKIAVYHGEDAELTQTLIKSQEFSLVLSGHTHQSIIEVIGKTQHINPGSTLDFTPQHIDSFPSVALYDSIKNTARLVKF